MRRCLFILVLVAVLGLAGSAAASARYPAHARHRGRTASCAKRQPVSVTFIRAEGRTWGRLSWKPGPAAPRRARYRVVRNGRVVGQTYLHSMRVPVVYGRRYRITVALVSAAGAPLRCARPLVGLMNAYRLPTTPGFAAVSDDTGSTVRISWQPSARGDGALAGYRILRDGAVYGQTKSTSMTIRVATNRVYAFRIVAVDRNGHLSPASAPIRVEVGHTPPTTPTDLLVSSSGPTSVALSWQPSQAQGRIAGYRVMRDGKPVGQFAGTSVTLGNLTPSTTYSYSVAAVDGLGYMSGTTMPVSVRTGSPGAPTAPGSLLGAPLNDTTVQLSWQASQPAQGRIIGYRVLRNGQPVGQWNQTTVTIGNLAASTTYTFTVIAIDSLGDQSDSSATVGVRTANPTPTSGHVYAFLLSDTMQSFQDFENHYQQVGTISPTYYDCNQSTTLSGANVPLITQWAQARAVKVLPRFNCQNTNVLHQVLTNPALGQQWINYIVGEATNSNYDGVIVDFEAGLATDRNAYTAFVTTLAGQLHAAGKELILAVSAKTADVQNNPRSTFFDYNALSAQADMLFVMGWGIHWATSAPGAQDDMTWVSGVVNYISTLPRVNKYILGMQLYAMDWADGGGSAHPATSYEYATAQALAASEGATPTYNSSADAWTFNYTDASGQPHAVWYTNAATEGDRMTLAHNAGFGGVGVWRLGQEDQTLWNNPLLSSAW